MAAETAVETDVLVVGSGPAGAMAAWALQGRSVRVLDAGFEAPGGPRLADDLNDLRARCDLTPFAIGPQHDGLRHLTTPHPISLKLRAPGLSFVIRDFERLTPLEAPSFPAVISLAKGGFGNAWGTGVYRFTGDDLSGFPVTRAQLDPHYDAVSTHIGISGEPDDLHQEFGDEPQLQPALRLSRNAQAMLAAYQQHWQQLQARGMRLGRSRLAVLTQPHRGRTPYDYRALEFLQTGDPAAYNPATTINELIALGKIHYSPGWVVRRFHEDDAGIEVEAHNLTGETATFRAKVLLLAAGALNSARIVLESARDYTAQLPLLDNPILALPLIHRCALGSPHDPGETPLAQLNFVLDAQTFGSKFQGSLYGAAHVPVAEWTARLPFSIDVNRRLLRHLLPASSLAMLFYPNAPSPGQFLRLRSDGVLEAASDWQPDPALPAKLARLFRRLGVWTWGGLATHARPGQGIHYAGTLPMHAAPQRHQLHPTGRLAGHRRVYVCDGSCFPRLPAKNLTFTIMANAHRIAKNLAGELP